MTFIHVSRGVNRQYWAQTRASGHRIWHTAGKPMRSYDSAVRRMTEEFLKAGSKRGRVLFTADYYDPIVVAELNR